MIMTILHVHLHTVYNSNNKMLIPVHYYKQIEGLIPEVTELYYTLETLKSVS